MTFGRVKASDRKKTFGSTDFTSRISHSQNGNGLVCGLSTRKMRTPCWTQNSTTSRKARQSASLPVPKKSGLTMSSYFFGGFSAYWTEPSGLHFNHSGCWVNHGWPGEHWIAKSSAISIPWAAQAETSRRSERIVAPFAVGAADRVDGREI